MRTAPQLETEQNGAKHFTVARRAIVTCFGRVMIIFAGICKGKLKIVTCFARQKRFIVFFLWRTKHVTISSFPLQMPPKSQAWNCGKQFDFRARCCWSRAGPVKKCNFHGRCIALTTNAIVSLSNMPGTTSGTAVQIVRGLG